MLTFNDFGQTFNTAGLRCLAWLIWLVQKNVMVMKLYKTYGRRLVWYQESLEIMFQAPDDLSTITGSVITSFAEKVRS